MLSDYEKEVLESIQRKLARVEATIGLHEKALVRILDLERKIMATLDDIATQATGQSTKLDTALAEIKVLQQTVTDGGTANQQKVDAVAAILTTNDGKIDAIVAAAAPTPPPAPKA